MKKIKYEVQRKLYIFNLRNNKLKVAESMPLSAKSELTYNDNHIRGETSEEDIFRGGYLTVKDGNY